ncbi:cell division protein FtsZ, partial [Thermococci archaeon]
KLGAKSEIKWGARIDKELGKVVRAMVIMTGVRSPHILSSDVNALTTGDNVIISNPINRRINKDSEIESLFDEVSGKKKANVIINPEIERIVKGAVDYDLS